MRQAVLLGYANTKRTKYFKQAAAQAGLPVLFAEWDQLEMWKEKFTQGEWLMKIDPPLWDSCSLGELNSLTNQYKQKLLELSNMAKSCKLYFLNDPIGIGELLNKRECKKKLEQAGLTVTKSLEMGQSGIYTAEQLFHAMDASKVHQVFIKPVNGSGAAGVSAFRWQPKTGRMALYTCALLHQEYGLVNTKRLRRISTREEVTAYLEHILKLDCVVERWYAKAEYAGYSYDLRSVVWDGTLEFLLGRLSKGPITNLHLNNHPLEASKLGMDKKAIAQIASLCQNAVNCFPGIRIAGVDILLEKGSMRPRIIEMNAQGDLIYQDIFHENRIYARQVEMMKEWMG